MDNGRMETILSEVSDSIAGNPGFWDIKVGGIPMMCISDSSHNRMRIMTPVSKVENLKKGQLKECMEANFHSALDVKYAISDEFIWVVFIHPLSELSDLQLRDAISQVWNAAYTFGTTYSSGNLLFPGNEKKAKNKKM